MLVQSLLALAALVTLAGAVLLDALVTARAAAHAQLVARTHAALDDAQVAFVVWAQGRVRRYGASDAVRWPPQTQPFVDAVPCAGPGSATPAPCSVAASATWHVDGSTSAGAPSLASPPAGASEAGNLAPAVNEQRLAATIVVHLAATNASTVLAAGTRELTARIFEAAPYVVITAARDIEAEAGDVHAAEGDTGGAPPLSEQLTGRRDATPDPALPAQFTQTEITASIDCVNSSGFDERAPLRDVAPNGAIDYSFRPYGNRDWAYEVPCTPPVQPTPPGPLRGFVPPDGATYATAPDGSHPATWMKRAAARSAFPW